MSLGIGIGMRMGAAKAATTGGPVTLNNLTISPTTATAGSAYSGTISGNTAGSTITATSSDGTVLTVTGTTISGTFTGSAPTITLVETLGGATNSPHTSTVAMTVTLPAPTAVGTMTQFPMAQTPFQKDVYTGRLANKGSGIYPVALSAVSTAGTMLARFSSGGATRGDLIPAWQAATIAGTGAQTVNVRADCLGWQWGYLDCGFSDGAGGVTWQNGTTLVALGRLGYENGQSLQSDKFFKTGTTLAAAGLTSTEQTVAANWCRILATSETYHPLDTTGVVWGTPGVTPYTGPGAAADLAQWAIQTGDICGLVSHSAAGFDQSNFQPSNTTNTCLLQAQRMFDLGGAKYEIHGMWQGQGDSTCGVPYKFRKQDSNLYMFGVFTGQGSGGSGGWADRNTFTTGGLTARTGAVRWQRCSINNMGSISSTFYYYGPMWWQNDVRRADIEVMGATPNGVYFHEYGLDLTGSGVHPPSTVDGQVKAGRGWARCRVSGNTAGPVLTSATRDPSTPNSIILTWDRAVVLTGNWYDRMVAYFSGSVYNWAPFASGNQTGLPSNQARVVFNTTTWTPTDGDAFDVWQLPAFDADQNANESGNMIRDASDAEGYGFGRSAQASLVAVTAAALNTGVPKTPNGSMPRTYVAPSSLWDVPMTTPSYDTVERLTGFGKPLIGGKGTSANLNNGGQNQKVVSNCVGQTSVIRFTCPSTNPASNCLVWGENGLQFIFATNGQLRAAAQGQTAISATLTPGKEYWAAACVTQAGIQLYVGLGDRSANAKLTVSAAITKAYSGVNGSIDFTDGGVSFLSLTGASLYEAGIYDTIMYTGATNTFPAPANPVQVGDAHLTHFFKMTQDSDVAGVQPDLVRVS
jgi:hypothetical protein